MARRNMAGQNQVETMILGRETDHFDLLPVS